MAFDFEKLMMNPIFAMGAGLFGGGPNAMMNAYELGRGTVRMKQEQKEHEEMMAHRRLVADNEREKNRLYGLQVEETMRNRDMESAQAAEARNLTRAFLRSQGIELPDDMPAPNAAPTAGTPAGGMPAMETVSPGFDIDAYATPVTPQTPIIAGPVDAPKPIVYNGSPEVVSKQHAGKLSPQGQAKLLAALQERGPKALTGVSAVLAQEEQLRRQEERDARAERAEARAEDAARRSQEHLDLAIQRFERANNKPVTGATAAARTTGSTKGPSEKPVKPAKAAAAPKAPPAAKPPSAAQMKAAAAEKDAVEGRRQVDVLLNDLAAKYENLYKSPGGITDPKRQGARGVGANLRAWAESTPPGQQIGRAVGTQNQSERDKITSTKPLLMASIAKATGIKATQLNSNRELEFYLNAATDPSRDIEVNRDALKRLREMFGSPEKIEQFRSSFPPEAHEGAPASNGASVLSPEEQRELEQLRARFGRRG